MIGTRFNIIDLSEIPQSESVVTPANAPLILSCGPTAKGTEKMIEISGEDYKKMFGGPDFKKFGQVSVQNQRMIDAGAKLLFKRVVASDATLANITTCADIKVVPNLKNQYDENGNPVYETVTSQVDIYEDVADACDDAYDLSVDAKGYASKGAVDADTLKTAVEVDYPSSSNYKVEVVNVSGTIYSIKVQVLNGTKTVETPVYTTVGNKRVKVQKKSWGSEAEISFVALTDAEVKTLNERTASNNLADKYKSEVGMIPTDDTTALVDANHVIIVPSEATVAALNDINTAENPLWGYQIDIDDPVYNGYWIVDKSWTETASDGTIILKVPENATTEAMHNAIEMHYRYALFTVADIGRGVSTKTFRIVPENDISKNLTFMYYRMEILEDGEVYDSIRFSMLPDVIYRQECVDLEMAARNNLKYSQVVPYEDSINAYVEQLAKCMDEDVELLQQNDFMFGTLRKGTALAGVSIGTEYSADITTDGIQLESGSDGSFTNSPMLNAEELVNEKILAFFSDGHNEDFEGESCKKGTEPGYQYLYQQRLQLFDTTDDIYDLDTYQIDACFDANYPAPIKGAIAKLTNYRADFSYFRDHGLACKSFVDAEAMVSGEYYNTVSEGYECDLLVDGTQATNPEHAAYLQQLGVSYHHDLNGDGIITEDKLVSYGTDYSGNIVKSTFISDWVQAYDVINPYDLKQITVTICYDLSYYMINHILNNVNKPFAGERNGAVIQSILPNTLNYKARVMPDVNEKNELEDIRCNFASYFKDKFIVESLYTSQTKMTQLSFINNVMAVQKVIKALRVKFPSIRYQFITKTEDLETYTTEINEFLSLYSGMFAELRFEYIQDKVAAANKMYRGALYFRFNDFAQGEQIDAYMLPTEII